MLVTTTNALQDRKIKQYFGIVSGEAIMGANVFKDLFAGIRDIVGGRSQAYENELRKAKATAIDEMIQQAQDYGANAVIGVDLDYETVGSNGSMLMVVATGTAVLVEGEPAAAPGAEPGGQRPWR
ncbi:MAG: heavy metal-binding domain-containing protein [Rhodospirillaceae bacterium]|nr:heavy metal-binding domain-containing protein [Rhodospirillaceae bacterium]